MRTHIVRWTLALLLAMPSLGAAAWDGQDAATGEAVEIEQGELVRSGNNIQFYDYATGEYHDADVQDINRYGSTVDVEVFDNNTGEARTLEMDDN